ncbi:MAG: AraC family transcriptional regulator ligand-binding domain-containing protein [Xanthobacteraceae bacterium]
MRKPKAKRFGALPSAAGVLTRLACMRARAAGIELDPLLRKAGLTRRQVDDARLRIGVQSQIKFLNIAANALRDEFLGVHLAWDLDLREIGLTYYVMASSETLGDALRRAERYSTIGNEGIALKYLEGKDIAIVFDYVGIARHSDRHQIEGWATALIRACRQLTNRRAHPRKIHPSPQRGLLGDHEAARTPRRVRRRR